MVSIECGFAKTLLVGTKDLGNMEDFCQLCDETEAYEKKFRGLASSVGVVIRDLPEGVKDRMPPEALLAKNTAVCWGLAVFNLARARVAGSPLCADLFFSPAKKLSGRPKITS